MALNNYDVIVIGVGSMGSSACYWLAKRGYKVLGLEQFDIPHEKGSHTGQSRIIRKAYFEHADYVPLLEKVYKGWQELEELTAKHVYFRTGLVYFGDQESKMMKGVKNSSTLHQIKIEELTGEQAGLKWPGIEFPKNHKAIYEEDAGFITPEKAIILYIEEAIKCGAEIRKNETVLEWKKENDQIKITTNKDIYYSKKLIITAGAWAGKLLPHLKTELNITRQTIAWMGIKNPKNFSFGNFPCWMVEDNERGCYYGFPILPKDRFDGPYGLKIAHHFPGTITDPDTVNRQITKEDEEDLRFALEKYLPGANGKVLSWKTCLYTNTKDENFIIDHLPEYDGAVTIACGFSGHGFKFVPVVGEMLADLAIEGKTQYPIDFLKLKRFL